MTSSLVKSISTVNSISGVAQSLDDVWTIIVIDIQGKSSHVNFINGNDERFFSKDRKLGAKLENWQLLLDTLRAGKDKYWSL